MIWVIEVKVNPTREHNADISKLRTRKRWLSPSDGWWNILSYIFLCYGCFLGDELLTVSPLQKVTILTEQHSQIRSEGYLMEWKEYGIWSQYLTCRDINKQLHHSLWSCPFHWWLEAILVSLERGIYQPSRGCHWFCQQSWMTTLCTRCILPVCRKAP